MLPLHRHQRRFDAGRGRRPPLLGRCLLFVPSQQLLGSLALLFVLNLLREGRLREWANLASISVQGDVFYVVWFLVALFGIACWLLGLLRARTFGCDSWASFAITGLTLATVGWYSLLRVAELHHLEIVCFFPNYVALCPEEDDVRGLATAWLWLPVGLFRILHSTLRRPWLVLHSSGVLWRHLHSKTELAALTQWPWWMVREALVGSVFWVGSASCLLVAASRATRAPCAPSPRGRRHGVMLTVGATIAGSFAAFFLTVEPFAWFWSFLASPFRKFSAYAFGRGTQHLSWLPEETFAAFLLFWILAQVSYLSVSAQLVRRQAPRQIEDKLLHALLHPFHAELEDSFIAQCRAGRGSFTAGVLGDPPDSDGRPGGPDGGAGGVEGTPGIINRAVAKSLMRARRRQLRGQVAGDALLPSRLYLSVRRSHLLEDSLRIMLERPVSELLAPSMSVLFEGEQGIDAGGLTRDWFDSVARALAAEGELPGPPHRSPLASAPDGGLAPRAAPVPSGADALAASTGPQRSTTMRALVATGRFLAMAVIRERPLPILVSPLTCKHLLLQPVSADDVRRMDADFFQHRVEHLLAPGGTAELATALGELPTFTAAPAGVAAEELQHGGRQRVVTEENKEEYVQLLCEAQLCAALRVEIRCLLEGFWDMLPLEVLQEQGISPRVLSALISGNGGGPDPEDWRKHSRTTNNTEVVEWFWEAVKSELGGSERCLLLRFATGSSRPPPGGFAELQPPFSVEVSSLGTPQHLPQAHTCANKIVLHRYTNRAQLLEKLLVALHSAEGFSTA